VQAERARNEAAAVAVGGSLAEVVGVRSSSVRTNHVADGEVRVEFSGLPAGRVESY
jgi:hypothetical protein